MKYLIVGLGNPGVKYQNTRHNVGFRAVDAMAEELDIHFQTEKHAEVGRGKFRGKILVMIKPNTFMNLSGKAVNYWIQQEKISLDNMLVITDDIALPFGKLRMKGQGSDGGHNGLKDIQAVLKTQQYPRLRFGVGNDFHPGKQADYVLGAWNTEEEKALDERLGVCKEFIKSFVTIGLANTMSHWNNK